MGEGEIRGGAVESRASTTGKVELERIFVESVNRGSKRIDRLESSSSSLPGRDAPATLCDECAAFSRYYRVQRGKRNPPETGSLNQEARDKRIFLFEETGNGISGVRSACIVKRGGEGRRGHLLFVESLSLFFFEVGKIDECRKIAFLLNRKKKKGKTD